MTKRSVVTLLVGVLLGGGMFLSWQLRPPEVRFGPRAVIGQPVVTVAAFNEGTTVKWPVVYTDENGDPVVPDIAYWRVDTFRGASLIPVTIDASGLAEVELVANFLMIPPAELNPTNPALPEEVVINFQVNYFYAGTKMGTGWQWVTLRNAPTWPFATPTPN